LAALVRIAGLALRLETGDSFSVEELVRTASEINRDLSDTSPHAARVKYLLAWAHALVGEYRVAEALIDEAVTRQTYGPDPRRLLPSLWLDGSNHVKDVIARCDRMLRSEVLPRTASSCFRALAIARAMNGEFTVARNLCRRNVDILDELGLTILRAASAHIEGSVELLAGDYQEAERILGIGVTELKRLGETLNAASIAALLARALLEQGRDDEVASVLESAHEASAIEISSRVHFRGIRARVLARRGLDRQAQLVGAEAVDMADRTESPDMQAGARLDLSKVFNECGSRQRARDLVREAIDLYEGKGNMVDAARARSMLDS
jgi:hypothetical protein